MEDIGKYLADQTYDIVLLQVGTGAEICKSHR